MSPTQDYLHGRHPEALAGWADELAGGRSWVEVEAEIVDCCEGRVDLLTQLLIRAETESSRSAAPARRGRPRFRDAEATGRCRGRRLLWPASWRCTCPSS